MNKHLLSFFATRLLILILIFEDGRGLHNGVYMAIQIQISIHNYAKQF